MRRFSALLTLLVAVNMAAIPAITSAAAPKKPAAKTKAAPKPSPETIKWGKAQCDKADKFLGKGDYEKARDVYSQVLWKLPLSPRAKQGLKKADAAIRAKQNQEREKAAKAARTGAADAQARLETDQKLSAESAGLLQGDLPTIAQRLVTLCSQEQFSAITPAFDANMKKLMASSSIAAAWRKVVADNGAFQSMSTIRTANEAGYDCVYVTCNFERASYDAKVVFNSSKLVSGFFVLPKQQ